MLDNYSNYKHYIAQCLLFSVNYSGYCIQTNILGFCNFLFVWEFCTKSIAFFSYVKIHMSKSIAFFSYVTKSIEFFICILLSVLLFYVFVSLPLVSPLWRSKTQNSGSACSTNPCSLHQWWLWLDVTREGNKWVRCIRNLQKALRKPCFRKQGATRSNLCCVIKRFLCPLQMIRELFV